MVHAGYVHLMHEVSEMKALSYLTLGDHANAVRLPEPELHFRHARSHDSELADTLLNLSIAHGNMGDHREADQYFTEVIDIRNCIDDQAFMEGCDSTKLHYTMRSRVWLFQHLYFNNQTLKAQ